MSIGWLDCKQAIKAKNNINNGIISDFPNEVTFPLAIILEPGIIGLTI